MDVSPPRPPPASTASHLSQQVPAATPSQCLPCPYEYPLTSSKDFTFEEVMRVTTDDELCAAWCRKHGLLAAFRNCPKCGQPMTLNGKRWRCGRAGCKSTTRSCNLGSFFENAKIPTRTIVRLMYFWAASMAQTTIKEWTSVTDKPVTDWYHFCRDICSKEMLACNMQVGGPGRIVEIDETSIKKKSKCGKGKQHPDFWLFGGVDRVTKKWFGIITYEKRTKEVLLPIIKKHVLPGTIIHSDKWSAYIKESKTKGGEKRTHSLANNKLLEKMGYTHKWVCHDKHYVDPVTGVHTNEIEGAWEIRVKRHAKMMRGVSRKHLPSYLDEYLWRSWYFGSKPTGSNFFEGLVLAIRKHYPV